MKVVVIGSGGREHSIVWKLSLDNRVKNIYTFTDNSGIVALSTFSEPLNNLENIIDKVLEINPDIVVVGPEEPLSKGITNILNEKNIKVFGPSKEAARIESSKIFSKKLMLDNNIPTAYAEFFSSFSLSFFFCLLLSFELSFFVARFFLKQLDVLVLRRLAHILEFIRHRAIFKMLTR